MPHDFEQRIPPGAQSEAELLSDLEVRCRTDVSNARTLTALRYKVAVSVRPANVADRHSHAMTAHTTEVRRQGALCLAPFPIMVGNVFHLTFGRSYLDTPPVLAVCDRCSMLSDASFELGFKFVQEIILPSLTPGRRGD